MQRRRMVAGRVIRDRRAGAFVEFPIGDETGLRAAQFRRHVGLNLTRRARHVPQAELIEGAVELLPTGALPPNLQGRRQILHRDIRGIVDSDHRDRHAIDVDRDAVGGGGPAPAVIGHGQVMPGCQSATPGCWW